MSAADHAAILMPIQWAFNDWLARHAAEEQSAIRTVNRHVRRADAPLLMRGPDGGQAALAHWLARQRNKGVERLFFHHAGATPECRRPDTLIVRLLQFLKAVEGFPDPVPATQENREAVMPNWLARAAARERIVVLVSDLDALEAVDAAAALDWLPAYLPGNVRLILGGRDDALVHAAKGRGYQVVDTVGGLPDVDPSVCGDEALVAIWASRYGLGDDDFARLRLPPPAPRSSLVYQAGNHWLLAGAAVQDAVMRRNLRDGGERQRWHLRLAETCFSGGEAAGRHARECAWQYGEAAHWDRLRELVSRPDLLDDWLTGDDRQNCLRAWDHPGGMDAWCRHYAVLADAWAADLQPSRYAPLLRRLVTALQDAGATVAEIAELRDRALAHCSDATSADVIALRVGQAAALTEDPDHVERGRDRLIQALRDAENALGDDAPETRMARHALAMCHEREGATGDAASLYRKTLACREKTLGSARHVGLIPHLTNLAAVLKADNAFDAARPLYQRALSIAERNYGNAHPTTAACLDNIAGLLYAGQDFAAAEDFYQRALGIAEQAFGPAHPATAASAHNLATVLDAREQFKAAEQLFRRALAVRQQVYGDDHMDTASSLHNLAGALDAMGQYAEAEPMYRRAVETWEKLVGKEHPATATSINNLADLLREKGEFVEAESLYRRNLETWRKLLGENHPHTVMTLAELAGLQAARGDGERAEPLLREAADMTARVMGVDNMQHINAVTRLAALLRDRGALDEARSLLRETARKLEGRTGLLSPALQKLQRHLEALDVKADTLH